MNSLLDMLPDDCKQEITTFLIPRAFHSILKYVPLEEQGQLIKTVEDITEDDIKDILNTWIKRKVKVPSVKKVEEFDFTDILNQNFRDNDSRVIRDEHNFYRGAKRICEIIICYRFKDLLDQVNTFLKDVYYINKSILEPSIKENIHQGIERNISIKEYVRRRIEKETEKEYKEGTDLNYKTVVQLKEICKKMSLKGYSNKKREELIKMIIDARNK